jgi:hypothetical protein
MPAADGKWAAALPFDGRLAAVDEKRPASGREKQNYF